MYARVMKSLTFFTQLMLFTCASVTRYHGPDIISKSKIELKPLHITASLDDIIIFSAPITNSNAQYFLSKPNSDVMKLALNISRHMYDDKTKDDEYNGIVVTYVKGFLKTIINPINKYKLFNLNYGTNCFDTRDTFREKEASLMENDFMIGPLGEEDHGNWVLSIYYKGNDDDWIELFQVITIEIIDSIPTYPEKPHLNVGQEFKLGFAYPVKNLESCEIVAPRTTFDRFYDRDDKNLDSCGFRIPNVTIEDEGTWRIIGVGNIVYKANVYLKVNKKSL